MWLAALALSCGETNDSLPLSAAGAAGARAADGCPVIPLSELCRSLTEDQCRARSPLGEDVDISPFQFCFRTDEKNFSVWQNSCDGRSVTVDNALGSLSSTQYHFDQNDKLIGVTVRDVTATDPCRSIKHYGEACTLKGAACGVATGSSPVAEP